MNTERTKLKFTSRRKPDCWKRTYRSLDEAKEASKTIRFRYQEHKRMKAYHCPNCWKYHLTTTGY